MEWFKGKFTGTPYMFRGKPFFPENIPSTNPLIHTFQLLPIIQCINGK